MKYLECGPYVCVNYLLLTGRQLVPHSRVRVRQPLFLVFNAVLSPPSVIVLHTQIILISAVLEQTRALQRDKKAQLCQGRNKQKKVSHCYSSKDPCER